MTDPNPEMEEGKREEERRGTGRYNSIVGKKSVVMSNPPCEAGLFNSVCLEKGFPRRRTELQSGSNDIFATAVLLAGSDCFHLVGGFFRGSSAYLPESALPLATSCCKWQLNKA